MPVTCGKSEPSRLQDPTTEGRKEAILMEKTTKEPDLQGSHLLHRWFPDRDHQQEKGQLLSESSEQKNSPRSLGFWLRLLLLMFLINLFFYGPLFFNLLSGPPTTINLSYSRFLQQVKQGNVSNVTISS